MSSQKGSPINPPDRGDSLLATHPSDHSAVYVENITHKTREKRAFKTRRRKDRELQKVKRGEMDRETYKRSQQHDHAFLVPIPIYYGYGYPFGIPCGPDGRCAAVSA